MKKEYGKPGISFFALNMENTPGSCAQRATLQQDYCAVKIPSMGWDDITVFIDETGCDTTPSDGAITPCYYVPTAGINVFQS